MLSVGLVVALAAGVFDLSIAGTLGLSAIVVTKLMVNTGMAVPLAIAIALGVGILIGLVNALLIVVFRIDSFIATLAMQSVLAAMVLAVSGNEPAIGVPNSVRRSGIFRSLLDTIARVVFDYRCTGHLVRP